MIKKQFFIFICLFYLSTNLYANCSDHNNEQTLMLIDNNYEKQFYTLSVSLDCGGEIQNLIKRVYSSSKRELLNQVVYPIEIGIERVMIQRLKMKDIVRFKVLTLDHLKGIIQVSYAKNILKASFQNMNVHINYSEQDGWQSFNSKGISFNHLEFDITTKYYIPYSVSLKKLRYIELPEFTK